MPKKVVLGQERFEALNSLGVGKWQYLPSLISTDIAPQYQDRPAIGYLTDTPYYWDIVSQEWIKIGSGKEFVSTAGDLTKAQRISDTLIGIKDQYTGEYTAMNKVSLRGDGVAVSDSDVDNILYFKVGAEYFRRFAVNGVYSFAWWNIVSDGAIDNVANMQTALNKIGNEGGGTIVIPNGVFGLLPTSTKPHCLIPKSNTTIQFSKNAKLKIMTNSLTGYSAIRIDNVSNVNVLYPHIEGDKDTHTGTTGESGMGIHIATGTNVTINDSLIYNTWGDGIYIGGGAGIESSNITISNATLHSNHRSGSSAVSVIGLKYSNITCYNNGGVVGAGSGIDLEPNAGTVVRNVSLNNIQLYSNLGSGFVSSAENVAVVNLHSYSNGIRGVHIASDYAHALADIFTYSNSDHGIYLNATNKVLMNNITSYSNIGDGIRVVNCIADINFINGVIYGNANGITFSGSSLTNYLISGIIVRNNTTAGITAGSPRGIISECHVFSNGQRGILMSGDYLSVTDSEIYDNGQTGVQMSGNYGRLTGCQVYGNGTAADITYDQITLTLNASYNNIINNQIKLGVNSNRPRYGVLVNSATNVSNVIVCNDLSGSGVTADVQDSGTSTIRILDTPTLQQVVTAGSVSTLGATFLSVIASSGAFTSRVASGGNWIILQSNTGVNNWILQRASGGSDFVVNRRDSTTGASIDNVLRLFSSTGNIRFGNTSSDPGVKVMIEGGCTVTGTLKIGSMSISTGSGSPEGSLIGSIGDEYTDTSGTAVAGGIKFYKQTGNGTNTGWIGMA